MYLARGLVVDRGMSRACVYMAIVAATAACGADDEKKACSVADPVKSCGNGQVCEEVAGQPTCATPVVVRGRVTDPGGKGIAGALVTALDGNDAPATGTATSDSEGRYELRVAVARGANGAPMTRQIKLRASAAGFETFPSGLRRSLPIELSSAMAADGKLVFQNSATDVVLTPVPNAAGLGSIAGTVGGSPGARGVLVVAEGPLVLSTISDGDGAYVVFNLPAGSYTVRGYRAGVQLAPAMAMVSAGARVGGVDLVARDVALGVVSGNVNFVNAGGASGTSVVLVVASTFSDVLKRGEVPPGLRAPRTGPPSVTGPFMITDVPDGQYVVLAAFENDQLVRDPDTNIGGTQIQRVTIGDGGRQAPLAASFKITGALAVVGPGAGDGPDPVAGAPTFVWKDDSSEDRYGLELFDSRGNVVWTADVPKVTGSDVRVAYGGAPLAKGGFYQFRATSFRKGNIPISQTEDLRGVFIAQ